MLKKFTLLFISFTTILFAQNYERYKKLKDTTITSKNLGFEKKVSITVPIEWQNGIKNNFPLIIVFDKQNKRSHNYIINTIDYLTSTEQIPSSIIISIESEQRYRYNETQYKTSDSNGLALENENFIFEELIPLAEKNYKASKFRILVGHSRYGYFTTSIFSSRINDLNGVISMSPFFFQKNIDLTDSISKMNNLSYNSKKYYRFGIGNDYSEDFIKMDSIIKKNIPNPFLDIKGYRFKAADHNATPGLLINAALYDIFEEWSTIQAKYSSNKQKDLSIKKDLEQKILSNYGIKLNFSIGTLNGKGWYFYNEKQYDKAIQAWQILVDSYPNFSQGFLYIIKAQIQLKQNYFQTVEKFKTSLVNSEFYTEKEKQELEIELQEITK
ncbi:alpha/beta hydrolase-fold protein [Chryseobacterium defluvii]|uniref:Putative esterase n=1 Tax=Chryseobacterium defluvii TaxID=160396 RepID=A0A495S9H4_9FLAO|nr:alpha/beta hydrolase-fold protein [Chryseobacterium defluvii]RKS96209.1 putative esterase [Chryseobacterium defluvii]